MHGETTLRSRRQSTGFGTISPTWCVAEHATLYAPAIDRRTIQLPHLFPLLPCPRLDTAQMDKLLQGLTQRVASGVDQHTVGLVTRLDFNGFYSRTTMPV